MKKRRDVRNCNWQLDMESGMQNRKSKIENRKSIIRLAHSPDSDDAFMFYALASGQINTAPEVYEHHLADIETLNRAAEHGKYEVTALSFHAYAYVADRYILLPHGASFGDGYGPVLVARQFKPPLALPSPQGGEGGVRGPAARFALAREWLRGKTIAVPGERTSALLALRLFGCLNSGDMTRFPAVREIGIVSPELPDYRTVVVPFDQILHRVAAGKYDAGLIIHEGQLTYHQASSGRLKKVVDLGEWWGALTGLPLPLGGNAIRRDLAGRQIRRISRHLRESIKWGLEHRKEALSHALAYGRGIGRAKADKFVGMYVNDYTLDYGKKGRAAVRLFLDAGRRIGVIPADMKPEWCQ